MDTVNTRSYGMNRPALVALMIVLVLLLGAAAIFITLTNITGSSVLTHELSEPLGGAASANVEIDPGDGNLTIDRIAGSEPVLVSGSLQYLEEQGQPIQSVSASGGQTVLTIKANSGGGQPWITLPWAACNSATEWQIHLNPGVLTDLNAHTAGGNVSLNLSGMLISRVKTETGGGNVELVLPDDAANLSAAAKTGAGDVTVTAGSGLTGSSRIEASSGAGNVTIRLPAGTAARIHATAGMGKVLIDSPFTKLDNSTYQSPDYDTAANRIEITVSSGAGNVSITTK